MSEQEILKEKEKQDNPDWRTMRQQQRMERRAERRANRQAGGLGWVGGVILITIGVIYLLTNFGFLPTFDNWWALFILLPGLGTASAAIGGYRRNGGQLSFEVVMPLVASFFFLGLTLVFLFELNYTLVLPIFLITAGILMLFRPIFGQHA
jgi:hypothetical protein